MKSQNSTRSNGTSFQTMIAERDKIIDEIQKLAVEYSKKNEEKNIYQTDVLAYRIIHLGNELKKINTYIVNYASYE